MLKFCSKFKDACSLWWAHFVCVIGTLATIYTISALCCAYLNEHAKEVGAALLVCSAVIAIYKVWPKNSVTIKLKNRLSVNVKIGDLFAIKKGVIVIPVNDYFDTQVDNIVIGENTLHGRFVKYFKTQYPDLDLYKEIQKAVKQDGVKPIAENKERLRVKHGYNKKFELGTVVRIIEGQMQYYLLVATEFDKDNHIISQPQKYAMILQRLYDYINVHNSGVSVYIPIIGSGQMGLQQSKDEILEFMLRNLRFTSQYFTQGGTTIMIYEKDKSEFHLNKLKYDIEKLF